MLERHTATETDMLERHGHRQTCWRDTWPQRQTCWRDMATDRRAGETHGHRDRHAGETHGHRDRQTEVLERHMATQTDTLERHVAPETDTDPGAASLSRASCVVIRPVAGSTRNWVLVRLYTTTLLLPAAESASVEAMMAACRTHGGAQQFTPRTFCILPHFPSPSRSVNDENPTPPTTQPAEKVA